MKIVLPLLLSGLVLCGCSQKQALSAGSALDLVQAGKDTVWDGGAYVLHVTKRDGTSLEGIKIVCTSGFGQKLTLTADSGTISSGPLANSVKLTLHTVHLYDAHSDTLAHDDKTLVTSPQEPTLVLVR